MLQAQIDTALQIMGMGGLAVGVVGLLLWQWWSGALDVAAQAAAMDSPTTASAPRIGGSGSPTHRRPPPRRHPRRVRARPPAHPLRHLAPAGAHHRSGGARRAA